MTINTTIQLPATANSTARILSLTGNCIIRDLRFDGNRAARGWPGGWDWQQSFSLFLRDGTFDIDNVEFINSASDGVHFGKNTTATVDNLTSSACFRGAITIVGGNSTFTVHNASGDWLHMEIDTPGDGGSNAVTLTANNCDWPRGVELEARGPITITNSNLGSRFWLLGEDGGEVQITDCTIGLGGSDEASELSYGTNSIYYPRDVTFTRCTFTGSPLYLLPEVLGVTFTGQHIIFDDCTFTGTGAQAIYNYGDAINRGNTVEFRNGCTYSGFGAGYVTRPGFFATVVGSLTLA